MTGSAEPLLVLGPPCPSWRHCKRSAAPAKARAKAPRKRSRRAGAHVWGVSGAFFLRWKALRTRLSGAEKRNQAPPIGALALDPPRFSRQELVEELKTLKAKVVKDTDTEAKALGIVLQHFVLKLSNCLCTLHSF